MDDLKKDSRFSHVAKDPRFRQMKKHQRKVKIDKRFQSMFKDKKFKMKYSVDKRGRPIDTSTNENLKKYYELSSDESGDSEKEQHGESPSDESDSEFQKDTDKTTLKKGRELDSRFSSGNNITKQQSKKQNVDVKITSTTKPKNLKTKLEAGGKICIKSVKKEVGKKIGSEDNNSTESSSDSGNEENECVSSSESGLPVDDEVQSEDSDDSEEEESDSENEGLDPDYARGEGLIESSSEEDSEDQEEEKDTEDIEHAWGELDKETALTESVSSRLAVCNMDWDRIKAHDIMLLLNSFKPSGGTITSVHIYPSEFGMERMAEEEVQGPTEVVKQKDSGEGDCNDAEFQREKLREYQLKRLKYYYAVVQCDCADTANHIYEQCDGIEYETTSNKLDLRFIPDDMEFDQTPKSVATEVPDVTVYQPKNYVTTALQQSAVQCTWDETDHDRLAVTMRKFDKDELEEMDLKDYIASSSDEESAYPGELAVTGELGESDESEEEQVNKYRQLLHGLNDKEKKQQQDIDMEISWEPGLKENTEKLVKKKSKEDSTPWESYLEKKREKKRLKRDQKKLKKAISPADSASDGESDVPLGVDMNDPYFKEELDKMDKADKKVTKKSKKEKKNSLRSEEKQEREQKEAELNLLLMDEDDQRQHFNLKQLMSDDTKQMSKRKRKKLKKMKHQQVEQQYEDNFAMQVDDPRFKELFENPHYNIDPSAPQFKKTKAVELLIDEKQKRAKRKMTGKPRHSQESEKLLNPKKQKLKHLTEKSEETVHNKKSVTAAERTKSSEDLARLIKSVKTKTQILDKKRKRKL